MAVGKVGLLDLVLLVSLLLSLQKYPVTPTYGMNMESAAFADGVDFNATIRVCKMIDVDGVNSTTADDTAYTEGWTIYLYKDGNLFDQQTTGADRCFTWRNLGPGSYMVIEADVAGWISTSLTNHDFGVVQGNRSYSFTFTNFKLHLAKTTLTLSSPTTTMQFFPVTLKATLRDERGNPLQGMRVRIHFPGHGIVAVRTTYTGADGTVSISYTPFEIGTLQFKADFEWTEKYEGSSATIALTVGPITPYIVTFFMIGVIALSLVKKLRPISWGLIFTFIGLFFWTLFGVMYGSSGLGDILLIGWHELIDYVTFTHIPKCLTFLSLPVAVVIEAYGLLEKGKKAKLVLVIATAVIISLVYYLLLILSPRFP